MNARWLRPAWLLLTLALMAGCSTREVTRLDSDATTDLSGRWNDTDSRLVAEEMLSDALSRPWLADFAEDHGRKPTVIVGLVRNRSHELINVQTFIKDIEREFVNTGRVSVVQAAEEREALRAERADQQEFASPETVSSWGREKGADFMLQGEVSSIVDASGKTKVVFYQADLELSNLETNEKAWIGSKKIKKMIKN
jgi:penicillin-binding protein activator